MENHAKSISSKCAICEKEITNINSHILRMHSSRKSNHKCDICDKSYISKDGLRKHKRVVHDGIKKKCTLCMKTVLNLNIHVASVHGH